MKNNFNLKNQKKISVTMSKALRHNPGYLNLNMEESGWVTVQDLLNGLANKNLNLTYAELDYLVENNDKQRFAFNANKSKIRANQGHSILIDLNLAEFCPPEILHHGTTYRFCKSIMETGLKPMSRQHVHLSDNKDTAINVGSRKGKPIVLIICARLMYEKGFKFYLSDNNVWLTDFVRPEYIKYISC